MKKDKKKKLKAKSAIKTDLKVTKSAASSLRKNLRTTTAATKEFKLASTAKPSGVISKVRTTSDAQPFNKLKTSTVSKDSVFKKALKKKKKK